jgi:hypothetical protein
MPVVHCGGVVRSSVFAELAAGTKARPVNVCFAVVDRIDVRVTTLALRGTFTGFMASFMALAPVRSAKRAMTLSERWSERLKIATYRCLAGKAGQYMDRWGWESSKKVSSKSYRQVSGLARFASV